MARSAAATVSRSTVCLRRNWRISMSEMSETSRRSALMRIGVLMNGAVAALLTVPLVGYLLSPLRGKGGQGYKAWVSLGPLSQFPEGQTRLAKFRNPSVSTSDGQTADIPCWVRHIAE